MDMSATTNTDKTAIWNRTVRPELGDLPAGAAQELLGLHLSVEDTMRVQQLSGKANVGPLSPVEAEELDHYLNVGRALEFLKAKARLSLRSHVAVA